MDAVRSVHRIEYPVTADLARMPREMLEMICQFLHVQDIVALSCLNKATYESLGQRISSIGIRSIGASLSERRTEDAFAMLGSFCRWLGSASQSLSLDEKLQAWRAAQELAGHAGFSQKQQDEAYRQVCFWACPMSEAPADDMLRLVQDLRASWFCKFFPDGGIFSNARPCRSFTFVSPYLEHRPYWSAPAADAAPAAIPSRHVAWLGTAIETMRLHENLAECSTRWSTVASHLRAAFEETPLFFRITLALDLIECIKRFPQNEKAVLVSHIAPLVHAADAEEKMALMLAVQSVKGPPQQALEPDATACRMM